MTYMKKIILQGYTKHVTLQPQDKNIAYSN